jgi:hypothetical protein
MWSVECGVRRLLLRESWGQKWGNDGEMLYVKATIWIRHRYADAYGGDGIAAKEGGSGILSIIIFFLVLLSSPFPTAKTTL